MKKLILISLVLATFASSAFAQTFSFSDSAKSRATAGEFGSDSDDVNAKDIYGIERTFFSAGYLPALSGSGAYFGDGDETSIGTTGDSVGTMSAFWAMPLSDSMTIGFAGEYKMNAYKSETSGIGSVSAYTATDSTGLIYGTQNTYENSAFNLMPVFRMGNLAFHYRLSRGLTDANTSKESVWSTITDEKLYDSTVVNSSSVWEHELGVSFKTDAFQIYVPVGVTLDFDSITTKSTNINTAGTTTVITDSSAENGSVVDVATLYINPQFIMPLEMGPMSQIKIGLDMSFDIYGGTGRSTKSVTETTTVTENNATEKDYTEVKTETTETLYSGMANVQFDLYFNPSLGWTTWEDKVDFVVDPTIGVKYGHVNGGTYKSTSETTYSYSGSLDDVDKKDNVSSVTGENGTTTTSYDNTVTPYFDVAVGTLVRPIEWLELRAGLSYGMYWYNEISSTSYSPVDGGTMSNADYTFVSAFNAFGGVGFIFGEDFFIDVYLQAGNASANSESLALDQSPTTSDSLFSINAYGVQLSYRF